eukprot:383706_1
MAYASSSWTSNSLALHIKQLYQSTNQKQLCFEVSKSESNNTVLVVRTLVDDKKYGGKKGEYKKFPCPKNTAMSFIGETILHLSKMNYFDRIIDYTGGDITWMNQLYSSDFTGLIQMPNRSIITNASYYNILCDMIQRDKIIRIGIELCSAVFDKKTKQLKIDASKLIDAIKGTNTLKDIDVGIYESDQEVWEPLLKQALAVNLSVTTLTYYGCAYDAGDRFPKTYGSWWPNIKKRNEESQRFNRILVGDEKDDGTWNNNKCPYQMAKKMLDTHFGSIPKSFFDAKGNRCFCWKCHKTRKDQMVYSRGKPAKLYTIPVEWVRFGLKTDEGKCTFNNVWTDWHVSFHGTTKEIVPEIFRAGLMLLKPGDITITGTELGIRGGHIKKPFKRFNKYTKKEEMFDPNQIYVSPSIKYSGHGAYAKKFYCSHPQDRKKTISVQFAFQLRIRSGSYVIGQETVGAARNGIVLDKNFSNNELEWYTKENIGIVLYGLLLKIKETNVPP